MGTVHSEDLKLAVGNASHPARNLSRLAVPELGDRALEVGEPRLADRKIICLPDPDPGPYSTGVRILDHWTQQITNQWNGEHRPDGSVQQDR
jgi:hypothetical protein